MTNLFDLSAHRFEIKSCMAANVSISVQGDFYYEEGFLLFQIILAQNVKKNCPSLTPDALLIERLTVAQHPYFSVFPGHPLMFHGNNYQIVQHVEMIRKCPSLTPDALERSQLFASLRFWTFRVIQSRFMSN